MSAEVKAFQSGSLSVVEENENTPEPDVYKPFKVFINHVDTFHSKYIASLLTDQIYGMAKVMTGGGGEEALGEAEESPIKTAPTKLPSDKYQIIGTLSTSFREPSEDILYTVQENSDDFQDELLKCGFVIYDISGSPSDIPKALDALSVLTKQLDDFMKVGPKTYDAFNEPKVFILISTVMTWALTKPLDPDDPDLPFSEVDYRKRRPHPNYKEHYNCEKEVIKTGQKYKGKLKTYVMCSGVTYGEEEDSLEFFFKAAWYNEVLPIIENGNNKVPFIHVRDLAKALHGLMETTPSKPQYILAVEQTPTTLKQFIKTLSKALSDSRTTNIVREEAFLYKNMTQTIFDTATVNINMEPVFLVDNLQIEWQNELNIAENMNQVVKEFRTRRNLIPVKIVLHGPPGCGKTHFANKLCEYYNCKYVSIPTMLEEYISIWRENMIRPEKPKMDESEYLGEEEIEEEMDEEEDPRALLEQIHELELFMEKGVDSIPDDYIVGLLKAYLAKNFCQNRGYVLDDYPRITAQAKELFGQTQNVGGEEEEAEIVDVSTILPDLVVGLVATDEFITHRIMKLSEDDIRDTPYAEDNILKRLETFRENNTDDKTVLNYFDELEVDILLIEVKDDFNEESFALTAHKLGPPCTFGLSAEDEEELRTLEEQERQLEQKRVDLNKQMQLERAEDERKNKMEAWLDTLEKLQMEEEKVLVAQSEPLRHYLMKYVFPTLTKALIQLATLKPDDPVDFLAEYLFKENPEGKMFDPSHNVECEDLHEEFRNYVEQLINENEAFDR